MRIKALILAVLVLYLPATAQDFELGNISRELLLEKEYSKDAAAPAAIYYKKGVTEITNEGGQWFSLTTVTERVKIYKVDGYKYATIAIPFFNILEADVAVTINSAVTYNIVNDSIVASAAQDDAVFTEEANYRRSFKKVVLPNVTEGSVIEYSYTKKDIFFGYLDKWYFQEEIPAEYIEYQAWIPQFFIYNRILSAYLPVKETTERKKGEKGSGLLNRKHFVNGNIYTVENIPAYKEEVYVDNITNYLPYVMHEVSGIKLYSDVREEFLGNWESIAKIMYNSPDFGRAIADDSYFKKELRKELKGIENNKEKIETVFNFVRDRMTWNEMYGYDCMGSIEQAYEEKTGNAGEINLMLVAMLKYADFNAHPVILSTRDNGIANYQSLIAYNYVVAGIESMGEVMYLDATSKEAVPGILPVRALNTSGRIIRDNLKTDEVVMYPKTTSKESNMVLATLQADGVIKGQVKSQYFDYNAYFFRIVLKEEQQAQEEVLAGIKEKTLGYIEISDYKINNIANTAEPVIESFSFSTYNSCEAIGDKLYLSPLLFYTAKENIFTEEERRYPVDFIYPRQDRFAFNITIPDGYRVISLPESNNMQMGDGLASYSYNVSATNKQVQILTIRSINFSKIDPQYYADLKAFYKSIIEKQNERIIFEKI